MVDPETFESGQHDVLHSQKKKRANVQCEDEYLFSDDEPCDNGNDEQSSFEFDDDDFGLHGISAVDDAYKVPLPPIDSTGRFYRMKVESSIKSSNETLLHLSPFTPCKTSSHSTFYVARLQHEWSDIQISKGAVVNVIGKFDNYGSIIINAYQNLLILHPDTLLTGTMISTSFMCQRRSIISEMFRMPSFSSVMITGTLLHELFQLTICPLVGAISSYNDKMDLSWDKLVPLAEKVIKQHLIDLYAANLTEQQALDEMRSVYPGFQWFHQSLFAKTAKTKVQQHRDIAMKPLAISQVLDIEENVWSPMYGLKGKVDVTGEAVIDSKHVIVPIEIKTGRNNSTSSSTTSHRAQTSLYTLMLSDRYGVGVEYGLLYYMRSNELLLIPSLNDEVKGLIMARNQLAHHLSDRSELPPVIGKEYMCKSCFVNQACAVLHKIMENGNEDSFGCNSIFNELTNSVTDKQTQFMDKWLKLLLMEEQVACKRQVDASLQMKCFKEFQPATENSYCLKVDGEGVESLLESGFTTNDHIIINVLPNAFGFASGFIEDLSHNHMIIRIDRALPEDEVYRVEKMQLGFGLGLVRGNLLHLLCSEEGTRPKKLSDIIVGHKTPEFTVDTEFSFDFEKYSYLKDLNTIQLDAIKKVILCKDYTLLFGMPGTGKTTAIVMLIRYLVDTGNTVLVSSYTNTALDNILLKYRKYCTNFVRLGNRGKVAAGLHSNMVEGNDSIETLGHLQEMLGSVPVVGVTCLGICHPIFSKRSFSYCIVDEAAQIMMPACIGPLLFAERFVLVGDPFQLPPVVQSKDAAKQGLDVSLFQFLYESHPKAVSELQMQYRMNSDIMKFANTIFYNNKLLMGNDDVANQRLQLSNEATDECFKWMNSALDPGNSLVFISTDKCGVKCNETVQKNGAFINWGEAAIIEELVRQTRYRGLSEDRIAVISQYRSQLKILSSLLCKVYPKLEVQTVDRFQGRDKDLVIMSFVRSNDTQAIGDLLKDWRRLNVAITRAKCKLILIGSENTLTSDKLYQKTFDAVRKIGIIVTPSDTEMSLLADTLEENKSENNLC